MIDYDRYWVDNKELCKYKRFIGKAKKQKHNRSRGDGNFYENHHIIADSMDGTFHPSNMVMLTLDEHYMAHKLMTELTFHNGNHSRSMDIAFYFMNNLKDKYTINSDWYVESRSRYMEFLLSKHNPNVIGIYHTPMGDFHSQRGLEYYFKEQNIDILITHCTVGRWCKEVNDKVVTISAVNSSELLTYLNDKKSIIGLTMKEVGFSFTPTKGSQNGKTWDLNCGENNHQFRGYYVVPWGVYDTFPAKYKSDDRVPFMSNSLIKKLCKNNLVPLTKLDIKNIPYLTQLSISQSAGSLVGVLPINLGFSFVHKESLDAKDLTLIIYYDIVTKIKINIKDLILIRNTLF